MKFEEYIKEIETSNGVFKEATKAEKRVQIAKDVIERINFYNLTPHKGNFILNNGFLQNRGDSSLQDILNKNEIPCEVCAKGALFCSYVGRVNEIKVGAISFNNHINNIEHRKLLEIFTKTQLDLIEIAFEGSSYLHEAKKNTFQAEVFYSKYNTSRDRLISICENIIENNGTFQP
jgi:hypothetical protein